jgi:hypothetical protein
LALDTFTLGGVEVKAEADGSFKIVKPFDAGVLFEKTYALNLEQENILGTTPVTYRLDNTAPAGATLTNENLLVTVLQNPSFKVNSTTPAGLYTHKVTLGNKVVEVKVQVVEAVKEINFLKSYSADAATFEFGYTTVTDNSPNSTAERITASADGSYTVVKPFDTFGQTQYKFFLNFEAINFAKPEFLNNQFSVALTGPSKFSTAASQLFSGIERSLTNSDNQTLLNTVDLENFNGRTGFGTTTSATALIAQQIDSGTPVGKYTFTITAGTTGNQITKDLVVNIVAPTPTLNFHLGSYTSTHDSDTASGGAANLGLETRNHVVTTSTDTFVIEKPLIASRTYSLEWITTLMNYQSKLLTAEDFEEATADSLITNVDNKKLFGAGTGIATAASNYPAATVLVKQGVTAQVIKAEVVHNASQALTITANDGTGVDVTGATAQSAINGTTEITVGTVTTTANAVLGTTATLVLSHGTFRLTGTNTLTVAVSNYPDVIELGERDAASAPAQYRFVNVGLSVTGPSTLFESFPTSRASILLSNNTNGLVLFNQSGSTITEANAKSLFGVPSAFIQDGNGDHNDPNDIFTDGAGLNRRKLAITSTTVAGTYTLRFVVDSLVKEIKIQINNAQPKVFVFSGTDLVDGNDADVLTNNVVTSGGPSKVDVNVVDVPTQGNIARNSFVFASSGSAFARLQIYDQDGLLPSAAGYAPSLDDKFVAAKDGVYTFEAPNTKTVRDILFAKISVADIALGEYTYAISKEYPDGRLESYSDVVEVTALDNNQLAVFGNAPAKFTNNWIVNEASYVVGTYKYSFTLGSTTLAFQVVVTEKPTLNITRLNFGTTQLNLLESNFVISKAALTATAVAVTANFTLDGLTTANYYTVTSKSFVQSGSGRTLLAATNLDVTDLPVAHQALLDATSINLGKLADASATVGEYVEYTLKFFSKSGTTYTQVGEDKIVNLMVNENAVLNQPFITLANDGLITEQAEAGEVLTVKSFGRLFNSTINAAHFVLTGLPSPVAKGAVTYIDPNTVTIKLVGNATAPYNAAELTVTLTVNTAAFTVAPSADLVGTIKLLNNVAIANPVFAPLNAATAQPVATKTITLTFDEVLYIDNAATPTLMASPPAAGLFVVKAGTTTLTEGATADNLHYVVTRSGNVITITIGANLAVSTVYEVTVVANKIFDVKGNALPTQTVSFTSAAS